MAGESPLHDLLEKVNSLGNVRFKAFRIWKKEVAKRIERYASNIQGSSPFTQKPKLNKGKDDVKGSFWTIQGRYDNVYIMGIAPNIYYIKGFNAPDRTNKNAELVNDPGVSKRKDAYFYGSKVNQVYGYFSLKRKGAYAKHHLGISQIFYGESFTDWMMHTGDKEIDRIVLEAGEDVLERFLNKK